MQTYEGKRYFPLSIWFCFHSSSFMSQSVYKDNPKGWREKNLIHNKHLKTPTTVKSAPYDSYSGGILVSFLVGLFSGIEIKWLCDGPQRSSPGSILSACCQFSPLLMPPLSSLWNQTLCYQCSEIKLHRYCRGRLVSHYRTLGYQASNWYYLV